MVVGLFSIITGKRCVPPRPFKRGGEQDAVYVGFSRDGFNFQRSPIRDTAFLPMSEAYHAWNFQNVQSVGGGFLTLNDTLRFFVGARSGDCVGARWVWLARLLVFTLVTLQRYRSHPRKL